MAISFRKSVMVGCWLINSWFCFSKEIPEWSKMYFWMKWVNSILLSLRIEKSFESVEIWWLSRIPIPEMAMSNIRRQKIAASPLVIFFCSIHLQRGRNKVATTPPTAKGVRNSLAKYKPAIKRNKRSNFFNPEVELIVMLNWLNVLFPCIHECKHIQQFEGCLNYIILLLCFHIIKSQWEMYFSNRFLLFQNFRKADKILI